ncbi:stage III sporulation protein AF [Paenactinomyces guangxiensis]|uniref:Stage III sporulation protein AF n=1 Tax=Paenactinomyces guangxiensis TaxID=1490290 RepID=A0A7W2A9L0_9BACL|nr:stage III sporulation protein AF [Paenactinomyces guangxiensis]MBA4494988.1 stage III sporulation protein AF [Paenactinomyces guangxiensis]MBH8592071.1 stage III sporulation protein AF [Paenactinomyces guangxiensis]
MEWLGDWLKQIVLLVLVATFIDLMLPNNAMERYVKLVMGLLIILAILSPIFQFLKKDVDLSTLAFTPDSSASGKMEPINRIKAESEKLKQTQSRLVQQQTEKTMEQMIERQVTKKFPVEVMEARVATRLTSEQVPHITQVQLVARMKEPGSSREPDDIKPIQPVEQVRVDTVTSGPVAVQSAPAAETTGLTRRIIDYLKQTWDLTPEQVQVSVEPTM